jgi:RHS repeat-associated protein
MVVGSVVYQPFGPVKAFSFGNGQSYARTFDQDGRISSYTLATQTTAVCYDAASRIIGLSANCTPPFTLAYGYDNLDRLTQAILPTITHGFSYDAVGNRLTKTAGSSSHTYAYSGTSNRLSSITPSAGSVQTYVHDANGSATADGINTYTFDTRGRLVQAVSTIGTTTYQVNSLGQRIRKTNSLGDIVYHYDKDGRLIAESSHAGAVQAEYLYLGDMPVAVVNASGAVHFVHADHLNTPRLIANSSGQAVWWWDQAEPFGGNVATENPSGLGTFTYNLRFPGQYFDKETNLHYNYFRDYDPGIGRYVQSDPIGLEGGINTYAYVALSPLDSIDPQGLSSLLGCSSPLNAAACAAAGIGALSGGITSLVANVATQVVQNQGQVECIDWGQAFLATSAGIALGAVIGYAGNAITVANNIAALKSIAATRGLTFKPQVNPTPYSYVQKYQGGGQTLLIKPQAAVNATGPMSQAPRYSWQLSSNPKVFQNPFTGQTGPAGAMSHLPLGMSNSGIATAGAISGIPAAATTNWIYSK